MISNTDTIVAQATASGRAGIAIVRVSGPGVRKIAQEISGFIPEPRKATYVSFLDSAGAAIDEGIALLFPAPNSFTGEDVLELQGHGSPAVIHGLIQRILELGARLARPGEFSERAFLNDKLDLAQAEAIADLINASSEQAARSALRSLQGEFSKKINFLVESLVRLRMYIEAAIDFAEEEIDFLADKQIKLDLISIIQEIEIIQASATQGNLLRDGITVVIAGKPNVGKSSLLNQISGKDSAIVTDIPGTTRDLLREHIVLDGMPMHIVDTAGLRDSVDVVEQEGIRRAHAEMANADVVLFITDATQQEVIDVPKQATVITVRNKIDLINEQAQIKNKQGEIIISLSAKYGTGVDLLKQQIKACVGLAASSEGLFSARRRHLDALARARNFLQAGLQQLEDHRAGELLADDLHQAQQALNEITGAFSADDLLGRIFSSFCVGK